LAGHKFRRQYPIGPYIADFVCLERRLVVEVDGGQHMERVTEDERRTGFIEAHGFKVLRFWSHDVLQDIEAVLDVILSELQESALSRERERAG
jgi:adenine-specific DNA-methyltransferase